MYDLPKKKMDCVVGIEMTKEKYLKRMKKLSLKEDKLVAKENKKKIKWLVKKVIKKIKNSPYESYYHLDVYLNEDGLEKATKILNKKFDFLNFTISDYTVCDTKVILWHLKEE